MSSTQLHNRSRVIPFRLRRRLSRMIRRLRTFEHEDVVRLGGALCDRCEMELRLGRRSL